MKRVGLVIFLVLLVIPLSLLGWISMTSSGLQWLYQLSSAYIPSQISIQKLEGRLSGPVKVSGFSYQQSDGSTYEVKQIEMDWNPLSLLSGRVDVQSLRMKTVHIIQIDSTSSDSKITLPQIQLPIQVQLDNLLIDDVTLVQQQQNLHFKRIQLSASTLFDQLSIQQASVDTDDYLVNVRGGLRLAGNYRHKLQLDWKYNLADNRVLRGNGELVGDIKSTQLTHSVAGPISMDLTARLSNLLQELRWQADINVKQFNSTDIVADWPALSGEMTANGSGTISEMDLKGSVTGKTPDLGVFNSLFDVSASTTQAVQLNRFSIAPVAGNTRVEAHGEWMPGAQGGQVDLQLKWEHLKWPLKGESWFDSPEGQGTLSGKLSDYQFTVQTKRPWLEIPSSDWKVAGQGNLEGMQFTELNIKTLQGEVSGSGKLDWKEYVNWDAVIRVKDINPATEWPEWPGKVSASLLSNGSYQGDQLTINGDITKLSGLLRNYPIDLSGKLQWSDNQLQLEKIRLRSGKSLVALNGRYGDQLDMQWSIDSKNLAELYPQALGKVNAQGKINGTQKQIVVSSDFKAENLVWQDIKVGSVKGNTTVDLSQWYQANLKLDAQNIETSDVSLQSAVITINKQNVSAKIKSSWADIDVMLKGSLQQEQWKGKIIRANINSKQFSNWHLKSPAALTLASDHVEVEKLCWLNEQKASACTKLTQTGQQYQTEVDTQRLSLMFLKPWLPADLEAVGMFNANAALTLNADKNIAGQINLFLPNGDIHYLLSDGEKHNWSYRDGQLSMLLNDQGINIQSSLVVNDNDSLSINARMPKANLLHLNSNQVIQGEANIDVRDIHLLESLIPEVQNAKGAVKLQLTSNGTLNKPGLKARVNLDSGTFNIPRLGLNITRVDLKGVSDNLDEFQFDLKAHSGDGNISVKGMARLNSISDWSSELQLTGKDFLVSKIPEANVQVSPNLKISIKPRLIDIQGNMHVPFARLNPKDVSSAVQASNDVIIVGQDQTEQQKWTITTRVRLTLDSDHVHFYGYGFEGDIGGSLLLEDRPGQLTRATGEIKIPNGRYRAYGQRLAIENGRLIFSGGPISNPGLDFRAKRVINEVTAGVIVSGTLLKPKLDLYSIPAMGQTDALAYLILGRPMESSSNQDGEMVAKAALALGLSGGDKIARMMQDQFGLDEMRVESSDGGDQASLVVGRYLSPKLYVSYGVGLIESINTFSMRYQLSDKWQLKAESGESQSADLFYTIER
jgi:translocation and assembly module TamB